MTKLQKRIDRRISLLEKSGQTLSDVFDVFFSDESLVFAEMSSATRRLSFSYGEIKRDILALAAEIASLGIKDSYIGLYGGNSLSWITAFWGILKSGNMPFLMNLRQPPEFGDDILSDLNAVFVIDCDGNAFSTLAVLNYRTLLDSGRELGSRFELPPCANRFAISTNGTTLKKKVCFYTGKQICAQILNIKVIRKEAPDLIRPYRGRIKALAFLPFYHVFGLEAVYLWYSLFGATFVFLTDWTPDTIFRTVRKHEVTHIFAVPLLWHGIEKAIRKKLAEADTKTQKKFAFAQKLTLSLWDISPGLGRIVSKKLFSSVRGNLFGDSIRFLISGGSPLSPEALRLINSVGYPLYVGYGMTELGITSVELSKKAKHRLLGSIGKPFPSVSYSVGADGRLTVTGSSVCEYMEVEGEPHYMDVPFDTGDIVRMDSDGRAYIEGRFSDIVFGDEGENLNPDFAERAFSFSRAVRFCVTGTKENSKLLLVIQLPPDFSAEEEENLKEEIALGNEKLPPSYRVREVFLTFDPIADKTAIKVSRTVLRHLLDSNEVTRAELSSAPKKTPPKKETSDIKETVRAMFADILDVPEKDIPDDGHFMNDLGGSSLDYFTLLGEINKTFGITLDFETEKFGYTLGDFETIIKKRLG